MILSVGFDKPIPAADRMQLKPTTRLTRRVKTGVLSVVQFNCDRAMETQANVRTISITQSVRLAIEDHALESRPAECCGLLSGRDSIITDIHPLRNDADEPETKYFATPEDLIAATRRMREAGQSLLGVYHTHPRTPAYPSASDVEMAFYPEAFYFIISIEPRVELKAFKIEGSRIEDVEIVRSQ